MTQQQEMVLMRIFIGESDQFEHKPLYQALVELFREQGIAGATVIKGAMGYGGRSKVHSDRLLRLSSDLPVIVEVIDFEERINAVLPLIEDMFQGGLITMEKARVISFVDKSEE
jgi:PII-like signaling protein